MKNINELFDTDLNITITNLTDDSRNIRENGLFFAIKGITNDGNKFISSAIKNGACVIVTDEDIKASVPVIKVDDAQTAYNETLNKFYDNVRDKFKFVSVTGTDGKTTVSEIIYQLLNEYEKTGYIGTNGIKCEGFTMENEHTTPMPAELYKAFNEFNKQGCKYVSLECSSERLATHKLDGLSFDVAVFTNLTRDHLDYHKTMENYAKAKAMSFEFLKKDGLGIINYDDEYKKYFTDVCNSKYLTYSINSDKADLYASNINVSYNNLEFDINGLYNKHIKTSLSGTFNVLNIMCAILALTHFGYDIDDVIEKVEKLKPIDARQVMISSKLGFNVMVDYGHTANAIKNLYEYVKPLTKGRVIAVYGAAGSRDPRRMIAVANYITENMDYVYLTIEDARYDEPNYLIKLMTSEVKTNNYELELNRDLAIKKAIINAKKGDLILILGKGLEAYQITNGKEIPRPNDYESAKMVVDELEKELVEN